jgi:hypothetical protein
VVDVCMATEATVCITINQSINSDKRGDRLDRTDGNGI